MEVDGCSCAKAQKGVGAAHWIGLPRDGLGEAWPTKRGGLFLNPPGGRADPSWSKRYGSRSSAVVWWRRLMDEWSNGNVGRAVFVGFNLDFLQASQDEEKHWMSPLDFPFCVPRKRLAFTGDSPTHGNVIVYVGDQPENVVMVFSEIGGCVVPC